jgi:hypothetical protein
VTRASLDRCAWIDRVVGQDDDTQDEEVGACYAGNKPAMGRSLDLASQLHDMQPPRTLDDDPNDNHSQPAGRHNQRR